MTRLANARGPAPSAFIIRAWLAYRSPPGRFSLAAASLSRTKPRDLLATRPAKDGRRFNVGLRAEFAQSRARRKVNIRALSLSLFSDLAPLPAGSGPCKPDRGNLAFGINARTRAGGRRLSAAAAVLPPRSFPTSPRSKSRFWITNQASRFPSTRFSVSPSSRSKFRD
jgi:hypothetical protein